jgi:GT2 family glycosyltransferase
VLNQSELPSVTIIVLNYNGLRHLEECFASLTKVDYPPEKLELMMVDNASTDDSVKYVRDHYPQVRIEQSEENVGFAAGNNLGAAAATGQYVVFLNNDMWVDPCFVYGLVEAIQSEPDVVCAGAKILNWDGSQFDFVGSSAHFAGYAYQFGLGERFETDRYNEVHPMLFACGGAMIVERRIFLDVGGFDEDYFIYYEDMDLGWRLWLLGFKVVFAPEAIVNHRHHGTMKAFSDYRKRVLFKRNALYTIIKNYSDDHLGRVLPAVLLATVDGVVEQTVQRGQLNIEDYHVKSTEKSRRAVTRFSKCDVSTLVAIHDVVEKLPQFMEKRRWIQQRRSRSDEELAALFRPFRFWPDVSARAQQRVVDAFGLQQIFESAPRRVLVISSDILPYPGMPTVGSGLRAWGVGQGLRSQGHEVVYSMPRAALKGRRDIAPQEVVDLAWELHTLASVARAADPDVIVVCNWPVMDLLPTELLDVPVILDQHGPHYMEREYQKFGDPEDNAQRKINALRKADFFTCAGAKQLIYFKSWLERAGWTEQEQQERTAAIPVSLSPNVPERPKSENIQENDPVFVYGGVFLPWQDPSNGLFALIEVMETRESGELYFFGGEHPVYPVNTGIFKDLLIKLRRSSRVIAPGMVSHDELIERYTHAHVAIDLMVRNPERELAFTTRTVEYLWCGLPVIYNDYAELSDYIHRYDAGWIVDPEDKQAIIDVLNDIFDHPEQIVQKSQNAQRLVLECLNWEKTIVPMDSFIRHPRMRSSGLPHQEERIAIRNLRYLFHEAWMHYRRGGVQTLWREGQAFLKRQLGFL